MKNNYSVSIFWLSVIAIAVIGYMMFSAQSITRASYVKNEGITISADKTEYIEPIQIDVVNQSNSKWGMEIMCSNVSVRMCQYGSQICCTASIFRLFGIVRNPYELYNMFHEKGLYSDDGSDVFCDASYEYMYYKYKLSYSSPVLHTQSPFDSSDIIDCLKNGTPVMVRTKHPLIERFWVVIIGINGGDFVIMDPMTNEYGVLSTYGNKVYEMVYFTEE